MPLNPCTFTTKDGKVLSYDEARQYLFDNPKVWEEAEVKAPKTEPKPKAKSKADSAIDYLQSLLDETDNVAGVNAELYRAAIKGMISAIKAGKSAARAIREAIKYLTDNGVSQEEAEEAIGKHKEPLLKAEGKEIEKGQKAVATRAATGTADERIREAVKKHGLEYEIESFTEAKETADAFIEEVGLDNAVEAVKNKQVDGAPAASIIATKIDSILTDLATATNQDEVANLYLQQDDLIKFLDKSGREKGRFNSFMQFVYANSQFGYSFEKQVEDYKRINKGEIDEETLAKFKELDGEIKKARKRILELEAEKQDRDEGRAVANMEEEFTRPKPLTLKQKAQRAANTIRNSMKLNRSDVFNSSSPAALVWDGAVEVVATTIEAGGTVAQAIQDGIAYIRKSDWFKSQTTDIQNRAEKSFRDRVKEETRTGITIDGEGKIKIPYNFLKEAYLSGAKTIDALVEAVQAELPDATPRQIRDAITRYGQKLNPTKDEVKDQIQQQKNIGKLISQIEDALAGIQAAKTESKKKELSEREESLRKQLKALTDVPVDANAARLKAAKTRAETKLKDLEKRLKNQDFSTRKPEPLEADKELEDLKAKVTEAQGKFDRAKYEAEIRNRSLWTKLGDFAIEFANLFRVLFATGELSFIAIQGANIASSNLWSEKGRKANSQAFRNLWSHFKSEQAAETWLNKLKNEPWYDKAVAAGLSITEQHAKLSVQEELLVTGYANKYWEWLGKPIELVSKKAFDRWKKANPLLAFERAANGFLNTLRVARYLQGVQMLENNGITAKDNPQAYKQLASVVNTLTGRKKITNDENVSKLLSVLFFSARNMASVMTNSTPIAFWYYGKMRAGADAYKPSVAQKIAMTDLMRMTVNNLGVLALVAAYGATQDDDDEDKWSVEMDPRSTLFLQAKHGKSSIDPWHGMRPWWVFQTRILMEALFSITKTDAYKSAKTGDTKRLGEGLTPSAGDLAVSQITSRFSPAAGFVWDWASGHYDEEGNRISRFREPYDIQAEAIERLYPMYISTVREIAQENPPLMTAFLAAIGVVGIGVNTEMKKEKTLKEKTKEAFNPGEKEVADLKKSLIEATKTGDEESAKKALSKYLQGQTEGEKRARMYEISDALVKDKIASEYGIDKYDSEKLLRYVMKGDTINPRTKKPLTVWIGNKKTPVGQVPNVDYQSVKQRYQKAIDEESETINALKLLDRISDVKNRKGEKINFSSQYTPFRDRLADK